MKTFRLPLVAAVAVLAWGWAVHQRPSPTAPVVVSQSSPVPRPGVQFHHRPGFGPASFPLAQSPGVVTYHTDVQEAPSWAVPYGREFWHALNPSASTPAGLDLGDVMSRAAHAISAGAASPELRTRSFAAIFDGNGVQLDLYQPTGVIRPASEPKLPEDTFDAPEGGATTAFATDADAHARFRTLAVRAGGSDPLYQAGEVSVPWSVAGNTGQGLLNPEHGVIEHYEARAEGIEVSWVLSQPLAVSSALEIEAELTGLSYVGQTESTHHFADANGVGRVYVTGAYLVDATGSRAEVPVEASGSLLRLSVPAQVLASLTYPVAIDPIVGTEFGVGNPTSTGEQTEPAVAAAGNRGTNSVYLVTWTDTRQSTNSDIFGARVDTNGTVLDASAIAICTNDNVQAKSAVAYNGTNFLVVWQDKRSGTNDIYGVRLGINGSLLDSNSIAICTANKDQQVPTVASVNTDFLVAWQDLRGVYFDIYATRVSGAGIVLDATGIAINTETNAQRSPKATSLGTNYFITYFSSQFSAGYDIYANRVTSDGVVLDGTGIIVTTNSANQLYPATAADGSNYLVVWQDLRNSGNNYDIYGARVSAAGTLLDTNSIAICTTNNVQEFVATSSEGTDFLVVWADARATNTQRDVYGVVVSSAGTVGSEFAISTAANTQTVPAAASDGGAHLVVHQSNATVATTNRIRANLIIQ